MENGKSKTHLHAAGSFKSTRTFSPAARSRPAIERLVPLKEENNKRKNTGLVVQHYRGGVGLGLHVIWPRCFVIFDHKANEVTNDRDHNKLPKTIPFFSIRWPAEYSGARTLICCRFFGPCLDFLGSQWQITAPT